MLGVVPLAISTGAGSGSQRAIGTGVLGGMLAATVLGVFFVAVFFVIVMRMTSAGKVQASRKQEACPDGPKQKNQC